MTEFVPCFEPKPCHVNLTPVLECGLWACLAIWEKIYSGDHKFVQNNAAFLLANLSMSRVNLAVL